MSRSSGKKWFRKSIVDYSEELSRSFAEAKTRVQQGIERLKLKNATETFKRIPSFRGSFRGKSENKKSKSPKKSKAPKNKTPPRSPSGQSLASTVSSNHHDINLTYRIYRKPFLPSTDLSSSASSESDEPYKPVAFRSSRSQPVLTNSYSFPRISRSRKLDNINIVFSRPFPAQEDTAVVSKTHYESCRSNVEPNKTPITRDQTHYESCQSNISLVFKEKPPLDWRREASPASSLDDSSDSELARSTDISYEEESCDEELPRTGPPKDSDVYWIPRKMFNLPRTSSTLSVQPTVTTVDASPGVSPIKDREKQDKENQLRRAWGMTYKVRKDKTPRKLFCIEETLVIDSGYSDRSGLNSRATLNRVTPSPISSMTPSPVLAIEDETIDLDNEIFNGSKPFVLKSFYV